MRRSTGAAAAKQQPQNSAISSINEHTVYYLSLAFKGLYVCLCDVSNISETLSADLDETLHAQKRNKNLDSFFGR